MTQTSKDLLWIKLLMNWIAQNNLALLSLIYYAIKVIHLGEVVEDFAESAQC